MFVYFQNRTLHFIASHKTFRGMEALVLELLTYTTPKISWHVEWIKMDTTSYTNRLAFSPAHV